MVAFEERRRSRRVTVLLPAESGLLGASEDQAKLVGRTVDISSSGLRLRFHGAPALAKGDSIFIRLDRLDSQG
ncbi:MAG: PilZ domain-containing protein, partial [Deltaproteobacteria bacterium]|nr:PilZ domain-containing protein [Deltaproteobacteria bacterium]